MSVNHIPRDTTRQTHLLLIVVPPDQSQTLHSPDKRYSSTPPPTTTLLVRVLVFLQIEERDATIKRLEEMITERGNGDVAGQQGRDGKGDGKQLRQLEAEKEVHVVMHTHTYTRHTKTRHR